MSGPYLVSEPGPGGPDPGPTESSCRVPAGRRGRCRLGRLASVGLCHATTGRPGPGLGGSGRHWSRSHCRWGGRLPSSLLHQSRAVNLQGQRLRLEKRKTLSQGMLHGCRVGVVETPASLMPRRALCFI